MFFYENAWRFKRSRKQPTPHYNPGDSSHKYPLRRSFNTAVEHSLLCHGMKRRLTAPPTLPQPLAAPNPRIEARIAAVLERLPRLSHHGWSGGGSARIVPAQLNDQNMFVHACWFLENVDRGTRLNKGITSYGIKHTAESCSGQYISNGMFIAAVIDMGFGPQDPKKKKWVDRDNDLNVWTYITLSSLKRIEDHHYKR